MNNEMLVKMMHDSVNVQRAKTFAKSDQLSLGELMLKLRAVNGDKEIKFDFGPYPEKVDSWRGIYAELSFPFGETAVKVSEVLEDLTKALETEFTGYKGGEFFMSRQTPMWVANYGDSGVSNYKGEKHPSVGVVDIIDGDIVIISTQAMES